MGKDVLLIMAVIIKLIIKKMQLALDKYIRIYSEIH